MRPLPLRRLLGVDFFTGPLTTAVEWVVGATGDLEATSARRESSNAALNARVLAALPESSGVSMSTSPSVARLVVAPSAPGLAVDLVKSVAYREALTTADLALTDSSFMVMLWRAYTGEKLPRYSGLTFLRALLDRPELKQPGAVFWVMPSADDDVRNRAWLVAQGFPVTADDVYLAPYYAAGAITDEELVGRIEERRPRVVMLAIGGGVQERVGLMLRARLRIAQPAILCLGGAIAFLTGVQVSIPPWADRMMLGLLFRFLSNPRRFWRRYVEGIELAPLLWRHRERLPPLRTATG